MSFLWKQGRLYRIYCPVCGESIMEPQLIADAPIPVIHHRGDRSPCRFVIVPPLSYETVPPHVSIEAHTLELERR